MISLILLTATQNTSNIDEQKLIKFEETLSKKQKIDEISNEENRYETYKYFFTVIPDEYKSIKIKNLIIKNNCQFLAGCIAQLYYVSNLKSFELDFKEDFNAEFKDINTVFKQFVKENYLDDIQKNPEGAFEYLKIAIDLFHFSAECGNKESQHIIASYYYNIVNNEEKAFEWCKRSADQWYPLARLHTASHFATGSGTKKNSQKVKEYYINFYDNYNESIIEVLKNNLYIYEYYFSLDKNKDFSSCLNE